MSDFASHIINAALSMAHTWKENNCKENDRTCYKYLFANRYETVLGNPWCAAVGSRVLELACQSFGKKNPFTWSLASSFILTQGKKLGLEINETPEPGCMFYYPREGGGHMGPVIGVTQKGVITVEGNSSNQLQCFGCPKNGVAVIGEGSKERTHDTMQKKGTQYIHVQKMFGSSSMPITPGQNTVEKPVMAGMGTVGTVLFLSAIAGGIYYAYKA